MLYWTWQNQYLNNKQWMLPNLTSCHERFWECLHNTFLLHFLSWFRETIKQSWTYERIGCVLYSTVYFFLPFHLTLSSIHHAVLICMLTDRNYFRSLRPTWSLNQGYLSRCTLTTETEFQLISFQSGVC